MKNIIFIINIDFYMLSNYSVRNNNNHNYILLSELKLKCWVQNVIFFLVILFLNNYRSNLKSAIFSFKVSLVNKIIHKDDEKIKCFFYA